MYDTVLCRSMIYMTLYMKDTICVVLYVWYYMYVDEWSAHAKLSKYILFTIYDKIQHFDQLFKKIPDY